MHTTGEKKILWALFVSIALNVIACAFYIYEWQEGLFPFVRITHEDTSTIAIENSDLSQATSELIQLVQTPKNELFALLHDKAKMSDGYCRRDFVLAVLYSFHYLDVERALGASSLQKRHLLFSEEQGATLFAGLGDSDYEKLFQFIDKEKWPYTPEGIYILLQNTSIERDPSLISAFLRTCEVQVAKTLLMRNTKLSQELTLELLLAGSWLDILKLSKLKLANDDLLKKARRAYIKQLCIKKPELACEALILSDLPYASQVCSDEQLLYALERFKEKPEVAKELATAILKRPRSDKVWQQAKLVLGVSQKIPVVTAPPAAVKKVTPVKIAPIKIAPIKKKEYFHQVQKGESLWSIAKKYHVSVELLRKVNKLPTDSLKPGTKLLIPNK